MPGYSRETVAAFVDFARRGPNRTIPADWPALVAADGTTEDTLPSETPEDE